MYKNVNPSLESNNTRPHSSPKVSVCVVTYNQKEYIKQCLQSIIDQTTNFHFEVIVSDDSSTDGTAEIAQSFQSKYPQTIRFFRHEKNIGASKNYLFAHSLAKGEYIAHIDGDDYALPGKLQIQSDFLDNNPDCIISWHRMLVKSESTGAICEDLFDCAHIPPGGFNRSDILRFITIGSHSSKMYRSAARDFPIPPFPIVDYFINVEQIGELRANFISNTPLGVYRAGIGIASSGLTTRNLLAASFIYFGEKYPNHRRQIGTATFVLIAAAIKNKNLQVAKIYLSATIRFTRINSILDAIKYRQIISTLRIPNKIRAQGKTM
ncbi:MAG: glycosyltransferase family 2 protein [Leptothrix sp. (in: b-proteobacteria)]